MARGKPVPCALTIAGSDSGGGAGIQADLKTFASLGVHGASAITCITAQNPKQVMGIQACTPEIVQRQIDAVRDELEPAAIKTGMLYSRAIIEAVTTSLGAGKSVPLVVDPVMVSTSGARLLQNDAVHALTTRLLPLATLVTPNLDEAEILAECRLRSVEDLRHAAKKLQQEFGCAVLVKGGHLRGLKEAIDVFYDGRDELLLSAPYIRGISTHGTGCTYSAAISGCLALGLSLSNSVQKAKEYISQAIAGAVKTGRHTVLNSFWKDG